MHKNIFTELHILFTEYDARVAVISSFCAMEKAHASIDFGRTVKLYFDLLVGEGFLTIRCPSHAML